MASTALRYGILSLLCHVGFADAPPSRFEHVVTWAGGASIWTDADAWLGGSPMGAEQVLLNGSAALITVSASAWTPTPDTGCVSGSGGRHG